MPNSPRGGQPNVLLIVSDQHRLDCVGVSDDYPVSTPHLDTLARDGAWFDSAYTPIPLCTPARQALLTGVRAESTGGLWNYDLGSRISPLDPHEYAWPRELQRAGYHSRYIGKWHVNPEHGPEDFGYDSWIPLEAYDRWRDERYPGSPLPDDWFGSVDTVPTADSRTHWMADRAAEFITGAPADQPWHLRVDFLEPHLPCLPSPEFAARYPASSIPRWRDFADDLVGKPYIQRQQLLNWGVDGWSWDDWAPIVARYYATIAQLDDAIGSMLRALEETGQADDTLVIYTTDHGDLGGSHGMMDKHYVMYDAVVRVPLALRWPHRIPAGTRTDSFAYNMLDLPPTIAAATGIAGPPRSHGDALFDDDPDGTLVPSAAIARREHVVATYNGQQFGLFTQRMIRTRSWKYVWNPTDVDELYDLTADPEELRNLISDTVASEVLPALRESLYLQLVDDGDSIVGNAWMTRQLREGRKLADRENATREGEHV